MTPAISARSAASIDPAASMATDGLSPAALLSYCTSRLNTLDEIIRKRFDEQKSGNDAIKGAGQLMDILRRHPDGQSAGAASPGKDHAVHHRAIAADLVTLYNTTSDPKLQQLIESRYRVVTGNPILKDAGGKATTDFPGGVIPLNPSGIPGLGREPWEATQIAEVKSFQDGLMKGNELAMIQLQSVISQRQLAVQITTQMMASMTESQKAVIGEHPVSAMTSSSADALYALGYWLLDQQRHACAVHVFRSMLFVAGTDERSWLGLGMAHEGAGETEKAARLYALGRHACPGSLRCALAAGRALRKLGRENEAQAAFGEAAAIAELVDDTELGAAIAVEAAA